MDFWLISMGFLYFCSYMVKLVVLISIKPLQLRFQKDLSDIDIELGASQSSL